MNENKTGFQKKKIYIYRDIYINVGVESTLA